MPAPGHAPRFVRGAFVVLGCVVLASACKEPAQRIGLAEAKGEMGAELHYLKQERKWDDNLVFYGGPKRAPDVLELTIKSPRELSIELPLQGSSPSREGWAMQELPQVEAVAYHKESEPWQIVYVGKSGLVADPNRIDSIDGEVSTLDDALDSMYATAYPHSGGRPAIIEEARARGGDPRVARLLIAAADTRIGQSDPPWEDAYGSLNVNDKEKVNERLWKALEEQQPIAAMKRAVRVLPLDEGEAPKLVAAARALWTDAAEPNSGATAMLIRVLAKQHPTQLGTLPCDILSKLLEAPAVHGQLNRLQEATTLALYQSKQACPALDQYFEKIRCSDELRCGSDDDKEGSRPVCEADRIHEWATKELARDAKERAYRDTLWDQERLTYAARYNRGDLPPEVALGDLRRTYEVEQDTTTTTCSKANVGDECWCREAWLRNAACRAARDPTSMKATVRTCQVSIDESGHRLHGVTAVADEK